MTVYQWLFL